MKLRNYLPGLGAALVLTAALTGSAMAAEAPAGISVQLDGKNLTFTDAVPQARDNRTFLPFRAVFEAMGAVVTNDGNVITATRDGKTLTMTVGSTAATVEENGTTTAITMDVAPYVDSTTWRTYVPVRFAAQAFGCNVGWDQEAMTAVIVDVDHLLGDTTYELMDNYFAYLQTQTQSSNQSMTGDVDLSLFLDSSLTGAEDVDMAVTGSLTGVSSQTAAQVKMDLDLSDLAGLAAGDPASMTAEELKAIDIRIGQSGAGGPDGSGQGDLLHVPALCRRRGRERLVLHGPQRPLCPERPGYGPAHDRGPAEHYHVRCAAAEPLRH